MPVHFTIYKYNPATQERAVLHERVPAQMVDWLCHLAESRLSAQEKAHGYKILKETHGRPTNTEIIGPLRAQRRPLSRTGEKLHHVKKIA